MAQLAQWAALGDLDLLERGLQVALEVTEEAQDQQRLFFFAMAAATFGDSGDTVSFEASQSARLQPGAATVIKTLAIWYDSYMRHLDELPWYVRILEVSPLELSSKVLYQIYQLAGISYLDIANELVKQDAITAVSKLRRIDSMFGLQDRSVYQQLLKFTTGLQSSRYTETFEPLLRQNIIKLSPVAPEPQYLIEPDQVYGGPAETLRQLLDTLEASTNAGGNTSSDLTVLTAGLDGLGLGLSRDQATEQLDDYLGQPGIDSPWSNQVAKVVARFRLGTDEELFRLLGPVNVQVNDRLDIDDICSNYGGCRMLTCTCFEGSQYDQSEDRVETWFRGACDICCLNISQLRAAFRLMLPVGGWVGCFCSPDCAAVAAPDHVRLIRNDTLTDIAAEDLDAIKQDSVLLLYDSINVVVADLNRLKLYRSIPPWLPAPQQSLLGDWLGDTDDDSDDSDLGIGGDLALQDQIEQSYIDLIEDSDRGNAYRNDVVDEGVLAQAQPEEYTLLGGSDE